MRGPVGSDEEACIAILREGSKSFHAASLLLPPRLRGPTAAVYGFCRVADDAVDRASGLQCEVALEALRERLDGIYGGEPRDEPVDRALAAVVATHRLPRAAFDALLEGFAWDVAGRRYASVSDLHEYCVRVAGTVGVLMAALMGERREKVLRRACDLGVAMQLTNIARDVGEDARAGRLYVPLSWLEELGVDADRFVAAPRWTPEIGLCTRRLLLEAEPLYRRAGYGIHQLPRDCRFAIAAARAIYADIGRAIEVAGYDTVSGRAFTSPRRKAWLLLGAVVAGASRTRSPVDDPVLSAAAFLVEAVADE